MTHFVASSFLEIVSLIFWNSSFSMFCLKVFSVELMCAALSNIVLSQNFTIPFINVWENSCRLEYHISKNPWSRLSIVGSNSSFKPLGISFDSVHCNKNPLWNWYCTFLSFKQLVVWSVAPQMLVLLESSGLPSSYLQSVRLMLHQDCWVVGLRY